MVVFIAQPIWLIDLLLTATQQSTARAISDSVYVIHGFCLKQICNWIRKWMIGFNQESCILRLWTSEFVCQYECRQIFQKSYLNHNIFEKHVNESSWGAVFFLSCTWYVYSFFSDIITKTVWQKLDYYDSALWCCYLIWHSYSLSSHISDLRYQEISCMQLTFPVALQIRLWHKP